MSINFISKTNSIQGYKNPYFAASMNPYMLYDITIDNNLSNKYDVLINRSNIHYVNGNVTEVIHPGQPSWKRSDGEGEIKKIEL